MKSINKKNIKVRKQNNKDIENQLMNSKKSSKSKEELKFIEKVEKRKRKLQKKYKKTEGVVINYTVIRQRSSDYVPLNKLGFFGKISNSIRYMFDMRYRNEKLLRQKQKEEEEILLLKIRLKKFILSSLEKVPPNSTEILLQIDNMFVGVLDSVLNTTVELNNYDYYEVKMNKNYLKYINKPHKLIMFTPNYNI